MMIPRVIRRSKYRAGGPGFNRALCLIAFVWLFVLGSIQLSSITGAWAEEQGEAEQLIIAFGDSLTAGYGLPPGEGFTDQLQAHLRDQGYDVRVQNAGVSGDTSSGGRSRLGWILPPKDAQQPALVIVELGANDALRGIDPTLTRKNMDAILQQLTDAGHPVLLAGMLAPPQMGADYEAAFNPIFPDLAEKHGVAFYPFFLEGVAADKSLNQDDGIHPNAEGVEIIVENIADVVVPFLEEPKA